MALYQKTVNIWDSWIDLKALQPGQWVEAGENGDRGVFCGVKPSGSVVVAWHGNAKSKRSGGYRGYMKSIFQYAKNFA